MSVDNTKMEDLFAQAEEEAKSVEQKQEVKSKTHPKLINLKTPEGVTRVIYFRMLMTATGKAPITKLEYSEYSFKSVVTGKNIYGGISPTLFGEEDYFKKRQREVWDLNENAGKALYSDKKMLANIYVIKDTHEESNNGEFKVLKTGFKDQDPKRPKSGSPIVKCINHIFNKEDDDFDPNIKNKDLYSLQDNGITLKMTIIGAKGAPDVEVTSFPKGKNVQGFLGLSKDEAMTAYTETAVDLYEVLNDPLDEDAVNKLIDIHLLGRKDGDRSNISNETTNGGEYFDSDNPDDSDDIPMDHPNPAQDAEEGTPNSGKDSIDDLLSKMDIK